MQVIAPNGRRADFNPTLNGFRGLCALLVFAYHVLNANLFSWPSHWSRQLGEWLWTFPCYGVEMFFMISGFVILGSLLRHESLLGFLQDRFIRIFTAWIPVLIAASVVCFSSNLKAFTDLTTFESIGVFVANFFLLPPLVPLPVVHLGSWSLTYEWIFYFAASGAALLLQRTTQARWVLCGWGIVTAAFVIEHPRAMFFLVGVLVFKYRAWFIDHRRWLPFPTASLLIFLLAWHATGTGEPAVNDTVIDWLADGRWLAALIAFAAAVHMFAGVALNMNREFAFLKTRAFQFLGNISYSFYLWHIPVMGAVKRIIVPQVIAHYGVVAGVAIFTLVSLALVVPLAWLSWQVFELRVARLLRKALTARVAVVSGSYAA